MLKKLHFKNNFFNILKINSYKLTLLLIIDGPTSSSMLEK